MRINNIGTDIVENDRIKKSMNDRFIELVLSKEEINIFNTFNDKRKLEYLCGRFAAKEAIIKCLSKEEKPSMNEIIIINDDNGLPIVKYKNYNIILSISHEKNYSIAYAIYMKKIYDI